MEITMPIKLLLLDDCAEDRFFIVKHLNKTDCDYLIFEADTIKKAEELLKIEKFDAFILDYYLKGELILPFIHELIISGFVQPIIILTGRGDSKVDEEVFNAGASCFLDKNRITSEDLDRSIRFAINRNNIINRIQFSTEEFDEKHLDFISKNSKKLTDALNFKW
jgi:DNA-binding response OmpR family regulator